MSTGELTELDTVEVSLVDRGANRKRFAFRKQEKVMAKQTMTKAQRTKLAKAISGKTVGQIRKDLSEVSPEGRKAIMAAIGILANAQAQLPDGLLQEILTAAGIETPADMIDLIAGDAAADASDGDMPGEDAGEDNAVGQADDDEAPADGSGDGISDDGSDEAGSDNEVVAEEYSAASDNGDDMPNDTKNPKKPGTAPAGMPDGAKKSLAKAEKDAADAKAANVALQKRLDDENAKRVELEKGLKVERDARVLKEWIAKAAVLKHLPVKADELGAVLKALHDVAPEETAKLEKMLATFDTKAGQVEKLLKEIGHTHGPAEGDVTAFAQLQVKAEEIRKAQPKLSEAQAFTKALELHPALYEQYNAEQRGAA